ncbi:hypothetical protein AGABI1DRAFT_89921 [Agaricus bisporus var. burnettii JB137-S8]|uniref:Uncharacterized protein n=1 Tax=Agaricus bisporus var. burnettii (strain JB137-S8 / ATCC MYA-4627 / FGSC 10392) TaxID=597362 RepID=K5X0W6_AGABU|nr:uncharacterized protein AGABI1DRAFT_89921 [Agaricus bisporus var. burnettii JB137-S8]EKM81451.1 hypothetical protein AGABI1DRAFT_89921 [Agaricus bisporus var. burnettii JB137-S8]
MSVPEPGHAAKSQLQFYHASFQDFLLDPNRSGQFVIGEYKAQVIFLQSWIYWMDVDTHLHTLDGWNFDDEHDHDSLPGLTWASEDNRLRLFQPITTFLQRGFYDPSTSIVRAEPSSPTDYQLLKYFNLVIGNGVAKPARFPLNIDLPADEWMRDYLFMGHGLKSVIAWRTKPVGSVAGYMHSLRSDKEPTEAQISQYRDVLHHKKWNEEEAASAMG